jgi:hypothetical protein
MALVGCAGAVGPVPATLPAEDFAHAESLRTSVERIAAARWNPSRFGALRRRAEELGAPGRAEWIDWFSLQRNYLIEIPGSGNGIVYVVAHWDKADANPLKLVSLMLNGLIDEAVSWSYLSAGAIDNATGVAVALELASGLRRAETRHTYRILLAGAEESGLRGSRAHVARLSDAEWDRIRYAVNVDSVAIRGSGSCVMTNASHPRLVESVQSVAREQGIGLDSGELPVGAAGDQAAFEQTGFWHDFRLGLLFNLVGGLLPQRSWFAAKRGTDVLTLAACDLIDGSDLVAGTLLLPVGNLHDPRDRAERVDPLALYEQFALLRALLRELDADPDP